LSPAAIVLQPCRPPHSVFNRRTAQNISHRFARLIEQAVATQPVTYHAIVATPAPA
jgi:hypothetical protein